jgi:tetratricopeptide (TPR) repeat protein
MHSLQYLWVTSYYASRESETSGAGRWNSSAYFITLVLLGAALFVPGPWLISYIFKYDFGASFLVFTALVNIHHFILDGAVWKLRDGRIAELLLGQKSSAGSGGTGPGLLAGLKWLVGAGPAARAVRIGTAIVLIILTGLDQARFYLGANAARLDRLEGAEALNPYDASVQVRIGRAQAAAGGADKAIESLKRAIAVNPDNPEPHHTLAQLLLANQRYEQAYDHYKQMVLRLPRDLDALANLGTLSVQLDRNREAIEYWNRALSEAPGQKHLHLYLAEAYERENDLTHAIPHYEQYLALLAGIDEGEKLDPRQVLFISLKLAQFNADAGRLDRALVYCQRAAELAARAGETRIESLALGSLANLHEQRGDAALAGRCYQRAILVDRQAGDRGAEGLNWFNYAQFLRRFGTPNPLVLACCLKAEMLVAGAQGVDATSVTKVREQIDLVLSDSQRSSVRDRLESLSREALGLQF